MKIVAFVHCITTRSGRYFTDLFLHPLLDVVEVNGHFKHDLSALNESSTLSRIC